MGGVTLRYTYEQVLILPASWVLPGEQWQGSGSSQALVGPSGDPGGHCGRYQDLSSQTGQLPLQGRARLAGSTYKVCGLPCHFGGSLLQPEVRSEMP